MTSLASDAIMHYLIKASTYYRNRALGWVAVVHGYPWHFFGPTGKRDAEAAVDRACQSVL